MRHEIRKLLVDGANGGNPGTALDIRDLTDACVFIDGTDADGNAADTFSVKVQAKLEGANGETSDVWVDLTGAIAASTMITLSRTTTAELGTFSVPWTHVRVYSTTIGTKKPRARVVGRNIRTE